MSQQLTEVIDQGAPNTVAVTRDLLHEIAAVSAAILDKREEKTRAARKFSVAIKDLEKRQRELIDEIRSGGTQLAIKFGTTVANMKASAEKAVVPDDQDDDSSSLNDDEEEADFDADEEQAH